MVVIVKVASNAGVRRVVVVAVVAGSAVARNSCMCSVERINLIMNRECGRLPSRFSGVASGTGIWNAGCCMIWIYRLVKISLVAIVS